MMIKLIASDIDGTLLLNGCRELSIEIIEQIERLHERGILFVAASGRQLPNLKRLFAPVQDKIAYIAENGALVAYQGEVLAKRPLERSIGKAILEDIRQKQNCEILLSGEHTCYLEPKSEEYVKHMKYFVKNNVTVVDNILEVSEDYLKISVYEKDGIKNCEPYFKEKWGNQVTVVTSGYAWLDMIALNVNKGNALLMLLKKLGISREETAAFGDHYNDIEMLQTAGSGYAVNSAQPGVADYCVGCVDRVETKIARWLHGENERDAYSLHHLGENDGKIDCFRH